MESNATLVTLGVLGISALALGRKYFAGGVCKLTKDLTGKVVIVTGSNTGIGKETARVLLQLNAKVVLACRDEKKTLAVIQEFKSQIPNANVEFIKLDLGDLKSIKEFVAEFKSKYQKLDILINNAGLTVPKRALTKDGFEMHFGVNHLGPFYLTDLLLDYLKKSAPSRVINLSSTLHLNVKMSWDDLHSEKKYLGEGYIAYAQSKLANVLFTKELQKRVAGSNIKVVAVHPGAVASDITRYAGQKWYLAAPVAMYDISLRYFGKNTVQGAQTTLHCALEDHDKLVGGAYYADCKVAKENPDARKEENWKRLWEISEKAISSKISN